MLTKLSLWLQRRTTLQKFIFLWCVCVCSLFIRNLWLLFLFFGLALILYPLMGLSLRKAFKDLSFVVWLSVFYFLFQLIVSDYQLAFIGALRIYTLFLFAMLLHKTTLLSDLMDMLEKGLKFLTKFGIDPAPVAFVLALTMRFIPIFLGILREVKEAQTARGLANHPIALFMPVLIRIIKIHDEVSQALEARSYPPIKK